MTIARFVGKLIRLTSIGLCFCYTEAPFAQDAVNSPVPWLPPLVREVSHPEAGMEDRRFIPSIADRIAVLLPRSGPNAQAAATILDGYLSGYFSSDTSRAVVTTYDTGTSRQDMLAAYDRAVFDGASMIVGPLSKRNVQALADMRGLRLPVLALNYLDGSMGRTNNLYQLGLAPEDEARQAAESAIAHGLLNAVAIVESDDRSARILASFKYRYQELGGVVLESRVLPEEPQDYLPVLRTLPGVGSRKARHADASGTSRSVPVDMVFAAVGADATRMLMPEFRFMGNRHLPVYATSTVLDRAVATSERNGLRVCDMPLLMATSSMSEMRELLGMAREGASFADLRLLGLGYDAYRVSQHLLHEGDTGASSLQGVIGEVSLQPNGVLRRTLPCAQIVNGELVEIPRG